MNSQIKREQLADSWVKIGLLILFILLMLAIGFVPQYLIFTVPGLIQQVDLFTGVLLVVMDILVLYMVVHFIIGIVRTCKHIRKLKTDTEDR